MSKRYKYDVFISHVFEDKHEIADKLNLALRKAGFRVWYSGSNLRSGDDLEDIITTVIPQCKYAIILITPEYLKSFWGQRELTAILKLESPERKIILPVWHGVDSKDVRKKLPLLADRFAISSLVGSELMSLKLIAEIRKRKPYAKRQKGDKKNKPKAMPPQHNVNESGMLITGSNVTLNSTQIIGRDLNNK